MNLQKNNFGLTGISSYASYNDDYDHLFKKLKEKRAEKKEERQQKKEEAKQRKEDKQAERQEKRELSSEKKRLKNEMKQTQIDEKKSQLSLLTQQAQLPPSGPAPNGGDNSMIIVAAVAGVIVITGIGYILMINKKQSPAAAGVLTKTAQTI